MLVENNKSKSRDSFKALGILLWYPRAEWIQNATQLLDVIASEKSAETCDFEKLSSFVGSLESGDLFAAQEEYVDTFDRVRSMSLHLFEHVHGDSRERGQAMIDLSDRYAEQGLKLASNELPDYLPMFLEYLAALPHESALEELEDIAHIIKALGTKLKERGNQYHTIFQVLLKMVGQEIGEVNQIPEEEISFDEMDKEWEEKQIEFLGAQNPEDSHDISSCGTCPSSIKSSCSSQSNIPPSDILKGVAQ